LSADPLHADSLHLLGVIGFQAGHLRVAEQMIRRAIALNGRSPDYYCNLGSVLQAMGRLDEAVASYEVALALAPSHSKAHNNLGNALRALGRTEEAILHYAHVLALCPQDADAQNNMGGALQAVGELAEAKVCYEKAIAINGKHSQACFNLGCLYQELGQLDRAMALYRQTLSIHPVHAEAQNNLGNVLQALDRPDEAIACYQRALSVQPSYAEAYLNLGHVLSAQDKPEEALVCYVKALTLKPDSLEAAIHCSDAMRLAGKWQEAVQMYEQVIEVAPENAEVHRNFGDALRKLGRLTEAAEHCRKAILLAPDDADAYVNLGNALCEAGNMREAIRCYERAVRLRPEHAISNMNLAVARLKIGDFASGWNGYEWRKQLKAAKGYKTDCLQPQWKGEPIEGQRILLYSEQGLGDCLQFLRYVPMVQAAGGRVILEVPQRMQRLAAEFVGIEELVVSGNSLPAFDWQCPLMSLPRAFGTDSDSIPAAMPYLRVPADAALKAQAYSWPAEGVRIGLSWAGNPKNPGDRFRSTTLASLSRLFELKGLRFYSLQLGEPLKQLLLSEAPVVDLAPLTADMADTAAFIAHLDLVITVDTSIAHLAGALGKPVWILLPANADWRWLIGREDTPWYPTARLFRQAELDDWGPVIDQIAHSLEGFAKGHS
jgi:tetratricopeptide (TPR) repeat protein